MRFPEGEPTPAIISVGMATGSRCVPNQDIDIFLGRTLGLTDRLMRAGRVGIEQRFWVGGQVTSDLCVSALQEAMEKAGIRPSDIKGLFVATSSPDMQGVSEAANVQYKAGLPNKLLASTNSDACPGFPHALHRAFAELTSPLGLSGYVAVIGAEVMSLVLGRDNGFSHPERSKEQIAVLVGDGAGAVIVKKVVPDKGAPTNFGFAAGVDGQYADELGVEAGGSRLPTSLKTVQEGRHLIHMNGRVIFEQAVKRMSEAATEALADAGIPVEEIDFFVPHQANRRIMEAVANNLQIPMEKVVITIDKYGNTSSSSIPIALYEAVTVERIKRNHIVLTSSFGAGLIYAAQVFPMVGLPR